MDIDMATQSENRKEVEVLACFRPSLYCGVTARFLLACWDVRLLRKARRICKSSAHGAAGKVGLDSSEKRLPLETAERPIVSVLSICRWFELDGPPVNGAQVSLAHPSTCRRSILPIFGGRCDRSCGYVLV